MYSRRVQLTGRSTYIVSLPKEWVEDRRIEKGSLLSLRRYGDRLLVSLEESKGEKTIEAIDVSNFKLEDIPLKLISSYTSGADFIEIRCGKGLLPEIKCAVKEAMGKLVGLEIVEESYSHILLQDLASREGLSIRKGLHRLYLMVRSSYKDIIRAISGDIELARDVIGRDDEIDKLTFLITKRYNELLRSGTARETRAGLGYLLAAKSLERIGDHGLRICENLIAMEAKNGLSELESLEPIIDAFINRLDLAVDSVMRGSFEKGVEAIRMEIDVPVTNGDVNLAYIMDSLIRVISYTSNIAEASIDFVVGHELTPFQTED
jgi:phosphate uptake regulator